MASREVVMHGVQAKGHVAVFPVSPHSRPHTTGSDHLGRGHPSFRGPSGKLSTSSGLQQGRSSDPRPSVPILLTVIDQVLPVVLEDSYANTLE